MLKRDKLYELITAAVQRATIAGAVVSHNVKIGGRQFDVVVELQTGMHNLLLAFEVKDHKRPTPVETVDAFVTKAIAANKAVIVSTSGFQSGAIEAAKKHSVDLFKLTVKAEQLPCMKPEGAYILRGAPAAVRNFRPDMRVVAKDRPTNAVRRLKIIYEDGSELEVPSESTQMTHCLKHSIVGHHSLEQIIHANLVEIVAFGERQDFRIPLTGYLDTFDEFFVRRGRVKEMVATVEGDKADIIDGNFRIDLTAVDPMVVYKNAITLEKFETTLASLPLGSADLEAGRFYFVLHPLRYLYCESLVGDLASLIVVESFQMGDLVRGGFTQHVCYSRFYLPVEDKKIIARLQLRLQRHRAENVMVV